MSVHFSGIPAPSYWLNKSSALLAVRKADIVLTRIDSLIVALRTEFARHQRLILTCDLLFTTDFWLKCYKRNPLMDSGRAPAVEALLKRCALILCDEFTDLGLGNCTLNTLPKYLEIFWGRPLTEEGVRTDLVKGWAEYITRADAAKYRVWFKHGRAYELGEHGRQPIESKDFHDPRAMARSGGDATDYGFFVLTMGRDLYMAKHRPAAQDMRTLAITRGFYHSAYIAGSPVQCAGSMLIVGGLILRIRLNSGHYKPNANNMRALIMALQMWGVHVETIVYEDHLGALIGDGSYQSVLAITNDPAQFALFANRFAPDKKAADMIMPQNVSIDMMLPKTAAAT